MTRLLLAAILVAACVAHADEPTPAPSPLERGVALFQQGKFAAAAVALEEARRDDPHDADAGLLLGIAYYRLHRSDEAEPLLRESAASSDPDSAASARIFLALIAYDQEDEGRARALLEPVAATPSTDLATSARALLDRSRAAPLSLFAMLRPEVDSNVPLQATAPAAGTASQVDADVLALGSLSWRPAEGVPLALDASASYRQQVRLTDYDFFSASAGLGYDDGTLELGAGAEAMTLGSAFYGAGGAGQVGAHLQLAPAVAPHARYGLRYRDYRLADYEGYTGFTHTGVAGVTLGARHGELGGDLDYVLTREQTRADELVVTGHGAHGALRVRLARVSVVVGGTVSWRLYDLGRRDVQAALDASVAVDLTDHLGLVAGSTFLRNSSNLADADYTKVTAFAGVYVAGTP
jgi:hypothetical protein